jgi:uridine phosphorylase
LLNPLSDLENAYQGITVTMGGFYGSQGRKVRLEPAFPNILDKLQEFEYKNHRIMNLEMETAALYGMSHILGHTCCSVNAIIAHRHYQEMSFSPEELVDQMIQKTLSVLAPAKESAALMTEGNVTN